MKFRGYILCCLFISALICGCDDQNSSEAEDYEIQKAFRENDCDYVKTKLGEREEKYLLEGKSLSEDESYMYNSCLLKDSGFSFINSLDVIFDNNGQAKDPLTIIQSVMGTDTLNKDTIKDQKEKYEKILKNCNDPDNLDDNMKKICGMTAAADTVIAVSEVALALSGGDTLPASLDGIKAAVEKVEAMEKVEAVNEIKTKIKDAEVVVDLDRLGRNLTLIEGASSVIESQMNVNFTDELDNFSKSINGGENSTVTTDTFIGYIWELK